MIASERQKNILKILSKEGIVQIVDLASKLNISVSSIRRDLIELENQGKLNRVHGGAIKNENYNIYNDFIEEEVIDRINKNSNKKDQLCKKISEYINDYECIFIDGGSTLLSLPKYIANKDIRIVTNNELFLNNPLISAKVHLLGGDFNQQYRMTVGSTTIKQVSIFNFDACFITCSGVSFRDDKSFSADLETTLIKKQVISQSRNSYLVFDNSKISSYGFCEIDKLSNFDRIITNPIREKENLPDNIDFAEKNNK